MILLWDLVYLGRLADPGIIASVGLIVFATFLAGWDSLSSDLTGYAIVMLANVCTVAAMGFQKAFSERVKGSKVSTFCIVYYNALIAMPLAGLCAVGTGELGVLANFPYLTDPGFAGSLCISCLMGLLLTYTSVLCVTYNSPLATSITGNLKDVVTTAIGWSA